MKFEEALELLKDGKKLKRIREESDYEDVVIWFDKYHHLVEGNDTISDSTYILKLEDVFATNWEEYKEPLLTEEEKEFLKSIIKMLSYQLDNLVLSHNYNNNENYLTFVGYLEENYCGSIYVNANYFKNLEIDKVYSIEELGLNES